ncbi:hypothetical protein Taro_035055 [Colocasia esculenta]|uniref:Uncharacterized protein n=1 Tax=Colocasia esculenta TaxID=4460 RepID=A0A843VZE7_COLES|nr:hypothetical protein [Colocasia esculenta]
MLCVFVAALSHPSTGAEAGARLASRACSVRCCALCSTWSALLLGLRRCSVCRVASLVERCDTCLWLLSAWCWLVVSSGEVLPESFSVGSGRSEGFSQDYSVLVSAVAVLPQGLRCAVGLAVFSRFRSPILGCQSVVSVVSRPGGVSRVRSGSSCDPSTSWRFEVAVLEFLLLWLVRDW